MEVRLGSWTGKGMRLGGERRQGWSEEVRDKVEMDTETQQGAKGRNEYIGKTILLGDL